MKKQTDIKNIIEVTEEAPVEKTRFFVGKTHLSSKFDAYKVRHKVIEKFNLKETHNLRLINCWVGVVSDKNILGSKNMLFIMFAYTKK